MLVKAGRVAISCPVCLAFLCPAHCAKHPSRGTGAGKWDFHSNQEAQSELMVFRGHLVLEKFQ